MFTTNAHVCDYVFLLTRTDPDQPRHAGLTTFLVPLDHPGVEIQGWVAQATGHKTKLTGGLGGCGYRRGPVRCVLRLRR